MSNNSEIRNPDSVLGCSAFRNPHSAIGNRGFTLIEIIVLIVMAGILLPAIIVPFVTSVKGSGKPEMATIAIYLAHERMEELMKYDYQTLNQNSLTSLTPYTSGPIPNYQWQWELVHVMSDFTIPNPDSNFGYIRIYVRVRDLQGDTYDVTSVVTDFP